MPQRITTAMVRKVTDVTGMDFVDVTAQEGALSLIHI